MQSVSFPLQTQSLSELSRPPHRNFDTNTPLERNAQGSVEKRLDAGDVSQVDHLFPVGAEKQLGGQFFGKHVEAFAVQRLFRAEMHPHVIVLAFEEENIGKPDEVALFAVFDKNQALWPQVIWPGGIAG